MFVRAMTAAFAVMLAAVPLAASAETFDFIIKSVDISIPAELATKLGPVQIRCAIVGGGGLIANVTLPLTNGHYSATNVHVLLNAGTGTASTYPNWSCYLSIANNGGGPVDQWLLIPANAASIKPNIVTKDDDVHSGTF